MKRVMVGLVIMIVSLAFADVVEGKLDGNAQMTENVMLSGIEYDCPDGVAYREAPMPVDESNLANIDDPTSYRELTPTIRYLHHNEKGSMWYDWDNDVLVYGGEVGEGQDWDYDVTNGHIYAIFDTYHSTDDSLVVYRSTDGGDSFQYWRASTNMDGMIGNPKIRIMQDGGGQVWVCMFGIWHEPGGEDRLYMRRMTPDQTQAEWELVTSVDVDWADVDATAGTGGRVYCTYIPSGSENDIWAAYNDCEGSGWQGDQSLFANPECYPSPHIASYASVGHVAVGFIDDRITTNEEVRIKRSTDGGVNWIGSEQVSNNSGAAPLINLDIAYAYPGSNGWIFVSFNWTSGANLGYYYTTNNGVNWTYGAVIGADSVENNVSVRSRRASGSITVVYNHDPGDDVMFTWASASTPTDFSTPESINDLSATGLWPPTAGWNGSYSGAMYSDIGPYNLYFDWFGNTAIAENEKEIPGFGVVSLAPNPSNAVSLLSYTIPSTQHISITLYDAAGSFVRSIVDETQNAGVHTASIDTRTLAAGIYFVQVKTQDNASAVTVTVVK